MRKSEWLVCLVMVLALCLPVPSLAGEMALVDVGSTAVRWDLQGGDFEKVVLTVSLPSGNVILREFQGGQPVVFEIAAGAKDGVYIYELRGVPRRDAGRLPRETVQSGTFAVHAGYTVAPDLVEPRRRAAAQTLGQGVQVLADDQVINDDLFVRGRACIGGNDCDPNESFGDDVIRLKGEVLRIHFDDTSTTTGHPANDWRLIANDLGSGGANKFSIEDSTGAKTPFTITAGAATNSIFVDSTGRLGLGTATPAQKMHIVESVNANTIVKVENSSAGDTANAVFQTQNNASAFTSFITHGSGRTITRFGQSIGGRGEILHLGGNGLLIGTLEADDLILGTNNTNRVDIDGSTGDVVVANNLTVNGTFSNPSSRELKEAFQSIDPSTVLKKFVLLPINEWSYKNDDRKLRHLGPTVEDFQSAFGLGTEGRYIFPMDVQGVTMAAVQGLYQLLLERDAQIAELQERLDREISQIKVTAKEAEISELKSRIETLEMLVQSLARPKTAAEPQR